MEKRLSGSGFFIHQAALAIIMSTMMVLFCFVIVGYVARSLQIRSAIMPLLTGAAHYTSSIEHYRGCNLIGKSAVYVTGNQQGKRVIFYQVTDVVD